MVLQKYKRYLPEILQLSEAAYRNVRNHLAPQIYSKIDIYIYASHRDFEKIMNKKQAKWIKGSGWGSEIYLFQPYGGIWFRIMGYTPYYIIKHELAHIMINRLIANVPAWLNEGLSMYIGNNEVRNIFEEKTLLKELQKGKLIHLKSLHPNFGFIEDSKRAKLAYAESLSAVEYFCDTYGFNKLLELIDVLAIGFTIENAFQNVLGLSYEKFEENWKQSLNAKR